MMDRTFIWTYPLVALLAMGCGQNRSGTMVEVSGTVTYNGQPVEGASVVFTPKATSEASQLAAQAETDAEGRFQLQTYAGGNDFQPGVEPGDYQVSITKLEVVQDMRRPPKHLLPQKYSQPKSSGLSATVTADGPNDFPFDL